MLIEISAGDIGEYKGSGVPTAARLYARDEFRDSTGVVIAKGSKQNPAFYQEFGASLVGSNIRLASGEAYSTTDSNNPNVTYQLVVYDANNREIYTSPVNWIIPPDMSPTTWAILETASRSPRATYAPRYMDNNALLGILNSLTNMALKASDVIFGATKLDTTPADLNAPTAVGINSPLVGLATTVLKGRVKLDTAPADANNPIAVGPNSVLVTTKATNLVQGKTALSVAAADPASPIALGANDPVLNSIEKHLNDYSTLAAAVTGIGSTQTNLVIKSAISIGANVTIPDNITVDIKDAGMITVTGGFTVTIGNMKDPGTRKVFAGAGKVKFSKGAVEKMNLSWWAGATDNVDVTAHFNEALETCTDNGGGTIFVPEGKWLSDGGHILPTGTTIEGGGSFFGALSVAGVSVIILQTNGAALFTIGESTNNVTFRNVRLEGDSHTTSTGILCEGTYPNSSAHLYCENVAIHSFTHGFRIHSLGGSWQFALAAFKKCSFGLNGTAVRMNSINTGLRFDDCIFVVGAGGWVFENEGCGTFNAVGCEFAGIVPYIACSGGIPGVGMAEGVVRATAQHQPMNFTGCQDEGFRYFIYHDAADFYSSYNITGCLVQSPVYMKQAGLVVSTNSNYRSKTFKDAVGTASYIDSRSDYIQGTDICGNVVSPAILSDFVGNSIIAVDTNPVLGRSIFRNPTQILSPALFDGNAATPLLTLGAYTNIAESKKILWIGRTAADGSRLFGYYVYRDFTTGRLQIEGDQALPNRGVDVNAEVRANQLSMSLSTALGTTGTISMDCSLSNRWTITPTGDVTINATDIVAGKKYYLTVLTSGTTTRNITFGTGFKSTGVLATGTVDAKYFVVEFYSPDASNMIEIKRTVAL